MRPGEAVHTVPAYVPTTKNPPVLDPLWEATRTDRSAVTHDVVYDIEMGGAGWSKVEPESVPCYSKEEAAGVADRLSARGRRNVRIVPRVRS